MCRPRIARTASRSPGDANRQLVAAFTALFSYAGRMEMQRHHPLATLQEAANLYNRAQSGGGFRTYLKARMNLLAVMGALIVLTSIACTAGAVVCLAGARAYLMLFALLLAPFILIGSLF